MVGSLPQFIRNLLHNLRGALKVATFQALTVEDFYPSASQLASLILLDLFLSFAISFAAVGTDGTIPYYDLPRAVFHLPLLLLAGIIAAKLSRRKELLLVLPIALAGGALVSETLVGLIRIAVWHGWMHLDPELFSGDHYYDAFILWVPAVYLAAVRLTEGERIRRVATILALTALVVVPLWAMPKADLWVPQQEEPEGASIADEEIFYRQPLMLDQALQSLQPDKKGESNIFFVGVAGDAEDAVFSKEMAVVDEMFRQRFNTSGHSIVLVNNVETLGEYPIASTTSLAKSLAQVGQVMDRESDVLFLYLSSHGTEQHRLALNFPPLELHDLDPVRLRQMLDKAGIKWRIIAVSACYSGGFIDALKDDHTMVLTASDADHTSFGCGTDSEFTYFGKAYFDEQLRHTYSFTGSFDKARQSIARREKDEGEPASNPQIYVGKAMPEKLKQLEARLETLAALDNGGSLPPVNRKQVPCTPTITASLKNRLP